MIGVVGLSFTVEYLLRGLYEANIGVIYEWIGGTALTSEEKFLNSVAKEYAGFIHETPWYAFPFGTRVKELWNLERDSSASLLRSLERRMAGLVELAGKAAWAWLIGLGTQATYAPEDLRIVVSIKPMNAEFDPRILILTNENGEMELSVPRYQQFTELVPKLLAENGVQILKIAGNKAMVASVRAPKDWSAIGGRIVNEHSIVGEDLKRVVLEIEVQRLADFLRSLKPAELEHLYDY